MSQCKSKGLKKQRKGDSIQLLNRNDCEICHKSFSTFGNKTNHILTHTDYYPYECKYSNCTKRFRTKANVKKHHLVHAGVKLYQCQTCGRKCSSLLALEEHELLHTDVRPYQCEHCNKTFRQISTYTRHLSVHSKELHYQCEVCSKLFARKLYLQYHMTTHTGIRAHKCLTCGKSFARIQDLRRHQEIHSAKKYSCEICRAKYSDPSSRRRHMKKHHVQYACSICDEVLLGESSYRDHLEKHPGQHQETVHAKTDSNALSVQSVKSGTNTNTADKTNVTAITSGDNAEIDGNDDSVQVLLDGCGESDSIAENQGFHVETVSIDELMQTLKNSSDDTQTFIIADEADAIDEEAGDKDSKEIPESPAAAAAVVESTHAHTYIDDPDVGSQVYFEWLVGFTASCQDMVPPLAINLYKQLTTVHKTLLDALAEPEKLFLDQSRFRDLLALSSQLYETCGKHLAFAHASLEKDYH